MNIKYPSILKKSVYFLLLCASSLTTLTAEERLTTSDLLKIERERLDRTPIEIIEQSMPKMSYTNDDAYLDRINKLAYTFPINFINGTEKLQLLDESIWSLNSFQAHKVRKWVQADTLFIKPNASCFSRYSYVLYNRTTGEAIEANFAGIPSEYNYYRQRIERIDFYNRIIQLDDAERTVWQMSFADSGFNFWSEGDLVIVGVNNDWRIANHPHILINASINQAPFCEASFAGYAQ